MQEPVAQSLSLKDVPTFDRLVSMSTRHPDLEPEFVHAYLHILYAGDLLDRIEQGILDGYGMSHGRFCLLVLLEEAGSGGCSAADLAEEAVVSRATITGLVDGLERDGYVTRVANPADRRAVRITITTGGQDRLAEVFPVVLRRVSRVMTVLSESERRTLVELLRRIQERAKADAAKSELPSATPNKISAI